jgi:Mrp family chromosome partitioning ATPase
MSDASQPKPEMAGVSTDSVMTSVVEVSEEIAVSTELAGRLVAWGEPNSSAAGKYRLLHEQLAAGLDPRVIAVISDWPGAGKTTTAANLALVLCNDTSSRVLLIDANLTRPGLAELFGLKPARSFMAKLVDERDASAPFSIARLRGTRLDVAALERGPKRNSRLDPQLLDVAIRRLRSVYDYIVIDGASVLESADADTADQCADGVVMTARARTDQNGSERPTIHVLGASRREHKRSVQLEGLTASLREAMSVERIAECAATELLSVFGADAAGLLLATEHGGAAYFGANRARPTTPDNPNMLSDAQALPLAEVLRTGFPLWFLRGIEKSLPSRGSIELDRVVGCVPLLLGGKPRGAIGISYLTRSREVGDECRLLLRYAQQVARALEGGPWLGKELRRASP